MPKYSAVIIARNEEKHIRKTIESILNQSIRPYRIVVVDDGSTDSTPEILDNMPVFVKRISHHNKEGTVFSNTLGQVRNVGLACVGDDPVDWIYLGDADTVIPPRYCEIVMKRSEENNACIGSGTVNDHHVDMPWDGFRMIKHDWLKSVGMYTKWESIYLCIKALTTGKNTLVCLDDDCVVTTTRPFGTNYTINRAYQQGRLGRKMGMPLYFSLYRSVSMARKYGFRHGYMYCKGAFQTNREVPEDMGRMYWALKKEAYLHYRFKRFNRRRRMLDVSDKNLIYHPP